MKGKIRRRKSFEAENEGKEGRKSRKRKIKRSRRGRRRKSCHGEER